MRAILFAIAGAVAGCHGGGDVAVDAAAVDAAAVDAARVVDAADPIDAAIHPARCPLGFDPAVELTVNPTSDSIALADLDRDGDLDLAIAYTGAFENTASHTGGVSLLRNTTPAGAASPSFALHRDLAIGDLPFAIVTADFDGDGALDLAVVDPFHDKLAVLHNATAPGDPMLGFPSQETFPAGDDDRDLAVADLNGDDRPDVAVTDFAAATASVLLNTTPAGTIRPTFAPRVSFATGSEPLGIAAGDLDGDGRPDLAIADNTGNTVTVLRNLTPAGAAAPSFAPRLALPIGSAPLFVAIADVDGDGRPDLLASALNDGEVAVVLNQTPPGGPLAFGPRQGFAVAAAPHEPVVADFDGDGRLDVVTSHQQSAQVSLLLNVTPPGGPLAFAPHRTFPTGGDQTTNLAVGDLNRDGCLDLVVHHTGPSESVVYLLGR